MNNTQPSATLEDAIALAVETHRGAVDKGGDPYILHPLRVMMRQTTATGRIAAVLHDVVEDGDLGFEDLRARGFSEDVVRAVDALTRRDAETYEDFVERASHNPIARAVKLADIEDNMDVRRLKAIDDPAVARLRRYRDAWRRLRAADDQDES